MAMDIERLDEVIATVAEQELMPRFGRLSKADIMEKTSAFDVLTTADRAVEAAVAAVVRETVWPGDRRALVANSLARVRQYDRPRTGTLAHAP